MSNGLRSARNYDGDVLSHQTGLDCSGDPSRAQQNLRDECDINVMVKRFQTRPELLPAPPMPTFQDFTNDVSDFQSAMNLVVAGERAFGAMPSNIRKEFDNDPQKFMDFVHNPDNRDEAIRLGMIPKPAEYVPPPPVRVVIDTPQDKT